MQLQLDDDIIYFIVFFSKILIAREFLCNVAFIVYAQPTTRILRMNDAMYDLTVDRTKVKHTKFQNMPTVVLAVTNI